MPNKGKTSRPLSPKKAAPPEPKWKHASKNSPLGTAASKDKLRTIPAASAKPDQTVRQGVVPDTMGRREAKETLRRSEEKYRSLFKNIQEGFAHGRMLFKNGRPVDFIYLEMNEAFKQLTGMNNGEGKRITALIPGIRTENPEVFEIYGRVAATGKPEKFETQVKALQRWFSVYVFSPEKDHFAAVFEDLTERKQAEQALRESEERFRDLYENATVGIYRTTPDGRILMANRILIKMLGYDSFNELAARNLEKEGYAPGYSRKEFKEGLDHAGILYGIESAWKRKDGSTVFVRESAHFVRDDAGNIRCFEGVVEDITDQKRAEEALQINEKKFRSIFDSAGDGIFILDLDGRFVEVNKIACERLGYTREEMLAMSPKDIDSATHASLVEERMAQIQLAGGAIFETEQVRRDGTKVPIEISARIIEFEGRPAILSVTRDITDRKRAEEELRQMGTRQAAILAAVPDIIMEVNVNKVYTWANPAGLDFFGLDVIGKEAEEYFEGDQDTYTRVDGLFQGDPNLTYVESWQRRRDGRKRLLAWRCMGLRDSKGRVIGALSSARDITEQREDEVALRKSEQKHRDLIQNINDVIYNMDREGRVAYVSPAVERLLGYVPSDLVGQDLLQYVLPEDRPTIKATWADVLRGRLYPAEYRMRKKDGSFCWVRVSNRPVLSEDGHTVGITGSLIDITARKEDERSLERHRLDLEELVRERTVQSEEAHRQLERVLKAAGDGIFGTDQEGKITFINDAGARMLGWTAGEILGRKALDVLRPVGSNGSPQSEIDCPIFDTIKTGTPHAESDAGFQKKDGSRFFADFTSSSVGEKGSPSGTVVVFHDITERKRSEEEMKRHTEELEKFNRAMINREKRIIEMKEEVNRLCGELGRKPKYPLVWK